MSRYDKITNNIDWSVLITTLALMAVGLICIYSAVRIAQITIFFKQIMWICAGLVIMTIVFLVDYRVYMRLAWPMYVVMVIALAAVLVIGREISGARRWLSIGPLGLQPSELAKIIMIVWLAHWAEKKTHSEKYGMKELFLPAMFILIPVGLILVEPDLGTAGIVTLISVILLLLLGVKKSTFMTLSALFISALPFVWFNLKVYQKNRILTFLDPSRDPLGTGYHATQSKIAVGSGGLWGKGFLHGTQTQLSFLPEHHTDFIFSVVAEEWGRDRPPHNALHGTGHQDHPDRIQGQGPLRGHDLLRHFRVFHPSHLHQHIHGHRDIPRRGGPAPLHQLRGVLHVHQSHMHRPCPQYLLEKVHLLTMFLP